MIISWKWAFGKLSHPLVACEDDFCARTQTQHLLLPRVCLLDLARAVSPRLYRFRETETLQCSTGSTQPCDVLYLGCDSTREFSGISWLFSCEVQMTF